MNIYQTINEIVQENMQLSGFLQGLGIDTCCGGQKTLAEACAELGLDPEDVLKQLIAPESESSKESSAKSQAERDWSQSTLSELIDHIETTHHLYVKKALPHLTDLMTRVVGAHGERHPEVLQLDELVRGIVADMGASFDERRTDPVSRHEKIGRLPGGVSLRQYSEPHQSHESGS